MLKLLCSAGFLDYAVMITHPHAVIKYNFEGGARFSQSSKKRNPGL